MEIIQLADLPLSDLFQRSQALRDDPERRYGEGIFKPLRLAVLGTYTTSFLVRLLEVFLHALGIRAQFYEAPYGTLHESILDRQSDLHSFEADSIMLLVHQQSIVEVPALFEEERVIVERCAREVERWSSLWSAARIDNSSTIIQSNFEPPFERALGHLETRLNFARSSYIQRINQGLSDALEPGVSLFDLSAEVTYFGLRHAVDFAQYHSSKQPWSFDFLPHLCHALARRIAAQIGLSRKCVVIDLDNTLWGGLAGDDGVAGVRLGPGNAEGEAYMAFQRYLKALKSRGVLLAVNSKNDPEAAKEVFASHPHMQLALDDISCFIANWEDKASNMYQISTRLNIGLDSLVFVDDSAQERHLIREVIPEIEVVELPDDPSGYIEALQRGQYFEVLDLTADAAQRTDYLVANRVREKAEQKFIDYDAYLESLEMRGRVEDIDNHNLPRVAELIQRTNQFNLRTIRHSAADVQRLLALPGSIGFCVHLSDRFGSHGIISVVLLVREGEVFQIDTWVMSCRAFKKTVENFVMQQILDRVTSAGATRIEGEYRPTEKNRLIAGLYKSYGFQCILDEGKDRPSLWRFTLEAVPVQFTHHIAQESDRVGRN